MFNIFNLFKKKRPDPEPESEWVEFICTVKHIIKIEDLAPGQDNKISVMYIFRYDPVTDVLQKKSYFYKLLEKKINKNNHEGKWLNAYLSDYKNAILTYKWSNKPFDIFKKVDEIKRDYYEKNKAEFREDSINDILNGIN